jgi:heme/copper-type cytochrome/quinol oxidase subunit 2
MHCVALLLQSQPDPELVNRIIMAMMAIIPIIFVVVIAIIMVPFWFILKKAGFSPWLSLVCVIPSLGALILLYVLAFAEWKVVPAPQAAYPPPYPYPPPPPQYPPQA